MCTIVALCLRVAYAPLAPQYVRDAILNGQSVTHPVLSDQVLGVATQSMIRGATCSPCWVVAGVQTPSGWPEGLTSLKSLAVLRYYSGNRKVAHTSWNGLAGQLIDHALLCVLWSVSPDSYFFAFPRDGVLQAVKATPNP